MQGIAKRATIQLNNQQVNEAGHALVLERVVSAKAQVVSGMNYELVLLMAESVCEKRHWDEIGCALEYCSKRKKENGRRMLYTMLVHEGFPEDMRPFHVQVLSKEEI